MKKILFLVSSVTPEAQRLIDSAQQQQVQMDVVPVDDVTFQFRNGELQTAHDFDHYDAIITRIGSTDTYGQKIREYIVRAYPAASTKMLNGHSYATYPDFSKLLQIIVLHHHHVPIPDTFFAKSAGKSVLPIVLKGLKGSNGAQVHYIETPAELEKYAQHYGEGNFLLQSPLPIGEDYRVIVLGTTAIAMHKKISTTGFVTNVSSGGRVEPAEPERRAEIAEIAVRAARALACEYAGVDVMYDATGKPRILEVNRAAGFNKAQEDIWQLNLSDTLIHYLVHEREHDVRHS